MSPQNPESIRRKDLACYLQRPFVRDSLTTVDCMFLVIVALFPSAGYGIYMYGRLAAYVIGISVGTAIVCELVMSLVLFRKVTVLDYSCVVTGFMLGLILPPNVPFLYPVIGSAAAILLGKMAFGGLGKNFVNPAAAGKITVVILYRLVLGARFGDEYLTYSPLTLVERGGILDLRELLLGNVPGCIGTGSVVTIAIGAVFLVLTNVIDLTVPLSVLGSFSVFYFLLGSHGLNAYYLVLQLCAGGLLFEAFFMATDYTTSPMSRRGKIWYGIIIGVLTGILRKLGVMETSALLALLAANLLSRLIDRRTMPAAFGARARIRRTTVHGTAATRARKREREEKRNTEQDARFEAFEKQAATQGRIGGSETAGTVSGKALELQKSRRPVVRRAPDPELLGGLPALEELEEQKVFEEAKKRRMEQLSGKKPQE